MQSCLPSLRPASLWVPRAPRFVRTQPPLLSPVMHLSTLPALSYEPEPLRLRKAEAICHRLRAPELGSVRPSPTFLRLAVYPWRRLALKCAFVPAHQRSPEARLPSFSAPEFGSIPALRASSLGSRSPPLRLRCVLGPRRLRSREPTSPRPQVHRCVSIPLLPPQEHPAASA